MKRNILFVLIIWLAIAAALEAGLRVYQYFTTPRKEPPVYTSHRIAMFVPHPFLVYAPNPEFPDHTREGFRGDRNWSEISKEDPFVIVCMGGSSTYGSRVLKEDSYPYQLGEMLSAGRPEPVEVINAGVGGYTTANLIPLLALRIVHLKPQVIIFYTGYNDAWNRLLFSRFEPDYSHALRPWSYPEFPWWRHSRLLDGAATLLGRPLDKNPHIHQITWKHMSGRSEDNWRNSSGEPFRSNLRTLVAIARAHGSRPILVTQATDFEHQPTRGGKEAWIRAMNEYTGIINEVAAELDVPVIDVRSRMSDHQEYFADVLHMNEAGNKERAKIVAEMLLNKIEF